jgi:hypothetical protein
MTREERAALLVEAQAMLTADDRGGWESWPEVSDLIHRLTFALCQVEDTLATVTEEAAIFGARATKLEAQLGNVVRRAEQVAWTNQGKADVSAEPYWSFVPTEAITAAREALQP